MSLRYHIAPITTAETLNLRKKVLKPHLQLEECVNPGDDDSLTIHLGLFHNGQLISISTFVSQAHPDFSAGNPYRLRGMATEELYRSQGFGSKLVRYGVEMLRERRCDFLWLNARIRAIGFYENLGFHTHGQFFEIKDIGAHKVMYKHIIPR